jgi:hypothetical protein
VAALPAKSAAAPAPEGNPHAKNAAAVSADGRSAFGARSCWQFHLFATNDSYVWLSGHFCNKSTITKK